MGLIGWARRGSGRGEIPHNSVGTLSHTRCPTFSRLLCRCRWIKPLPIAIRRAGSPGATRLPSCCPLRATSTDRTGRLEPGPSGSARDRARSTGSARCRTSPARRSTPAHSLDFRVLFLLLGETIRPPCLRECWKQAINLSPCPIPSGCRAIFRIKPSAGFSRSCTKKNR